MAKSFRSDVLLGVNDSQTRPIQEANAAAAILPGDIIMGIGGDVSPSDATFGIMAVAVASPTIDYKAAGAKVAKDVEYAAGERVYYIVPQVGDQIELNVPDGQTIVAGDGLKIGAAGEVVKATPATDDAVVVAWAIEDVTTSGAVGRVAAIARGA